MPGTVCINFHATKLVDSELRYTTPILLSLQSTVVLALQNSPLLCQFSLNLLPQDFAVVPIHMQYYPSTKFCNSCQFPDRKSEPAHSFPVWLGNVVFIIGQD